MFKITWPYSTAQTSLCWSLSIIHQPWLCHLCIHNLTSFNIATVYTVIYSRKFPCDVQSAKFNSTQVQKNCSCLVCSVCSHTCVPYWNMCYPQ